MENQNTPISLNDAERILADRRSGKIRLYEKQDGRIKVDHVRTANAMVMFIANMPADKWVKKILMMRIGAPLIKQRSMTHLEIALQLGMTEQEVKTVEREGLDICNEYMAKTTGNMHALPGNKLIITDNLNEIK